MLPVRGSGTQDTWIFKAPLKSTSGRLGIPVAAISDTVLLI